MRVAAIFFAPIPESITEFAEACLLLSPQLCLKRKGTIFVEIGSCWRIYSEDSFISRTQVLLRRFNLQAKIAIGNSILEALLLSTYGTIDYRVLPIECLLDCLDPFGSNPKASDSVEEITDSLNRIGIKCVQEFLDLPSSELVPRFGKVSSTIRSYLLSEVDYGWPLWRPEEKILERVELFDGERCCELEPLMFHVKPLLDRTFTRLWGRGLRAAALSLRLSLEKSSAVKDPHPEWPFSFPLPQTTARGTLPILRDRIARYLERRPLRAPVTAIELKILETAPNYQGQRHFFHNREDFEIAYNAVINALIEKMGKENVFRANVNDDAIAELSWAKTYTEQVNPPDLSDYIPERPLRVLPKPIQIQITNDTFHMKSRTRKIIEWSSPEEISTYRIDQQFIRSYYRLRLEGRSMEPWIFKCPRGFWYLHGWFG